MKRHNRQRPYMTVLHFRIWKRAGYAIMASLGKVVNISRLKVSMCASEEEKDGRVVSDQHSVETKDFSKEEREKPALQDILEQALSLFTEKKIVATRPVSQRIIYKKSQRFLLRKSEKRF
ncbi:MAG: hypothetical protein PHD21_05970 [Flavobacteriales bacterium]|nr:hypothetical protein [Flavobacteriales bacterium]